MDALCEVGGVLKVRSGLAGEVDYTESGDADAREALWHQHVTGIK